MIELKPCPYCNGEATLVYLGVGRECSPYCKKCRASIPIWFKNEEFALKAWNARFEVKKPRENASLEKKYVEILEMLAEIYKNEVLPPEEREALGEFLKKCPSANVEKIVRCKDCQFCEKKKVSFACSYLGVFVKEDGYCSYGKKRSEEDEKDEDVTK